MSDNFKSGFVSIIGRPNVGKSTLVNQLVHNKVSIISPKAQTTRNKIQGILTTENEQIIFIDTPGIHKAKNKLGEFMNKESFSSLSDCDCVLLLVDANEEFGRGDEYVIDVLKKLVANERESKVFLVFNKIDIIKDKKALMERVIKYNEIYKFAKVFYISALNGDNLDILLDAIIDYLPNGPMYYPLDQISDHPETFIISEIIREKVLKLTQEEVPHSVSCYVESMKHNDKNPDLIDIMATIVVERTSQKKIIIGKGGSMIKEIGTLARKDIVMLLGNKVYLELFVKVIEDWRNSQYQLKSLGYFNEE